jgi:hypothetical protein
LFISNKERPLSKDVYNETRGLMSLWAQPVQRDISEAFLNDENRDILPRVMLHLM